VREIRIYDDAGASAYEPTLERVTDMIDALNPSNRFVIAERSDLEPYDQHFIQAYLEDDGSWSVEYRAGDEAHHFGTHLAPDTTELPGFCGVGCTMTSGGRQWLGGRSPSTTTSGRSPWWCASVTPTLGWPKPWAACWTVL